MISEYINNYPNTVRVLDYKNEAVLEEFKEKVFENGNRFVKNIVTDWLLLIFKFLKFFIKLVNII